MSNAHTIAGGRVVGWRVVARMIQVRARRKPGKQRMRASRAKAKSKTFFCQPICCSKRASFLRPIPTNTPAAAMARRQTSEQSTSRVSCSASRPRTI